MADLQHETIIVPRQLQADEYGTIWKGEPGADGSYVVGDLSFEDDGEQAVIEFLAPEDWDLVRHTPDLTLGGTLVTDDETVDGGRSMRIRHGEVPSWMEPVGWVDPWGVPHKRMPGWTDNWRPIYAVKEEPPDGE